MILYDDFSIYIFLICTGQNKFYTSVMLNDDGTLLDPYIDIKSKHF